MCMLGLTELSPSNSARKKIKVVFEEVMDLKFNFINHLKKTLY